MIHTSKRVKYPRYEHRNVIPDWMGYPRSDYSRYDPYQEDATNGERKGYLALEGAGRRGWDYDQNRAYAYVHGNRRGTSGNQMRDHRGKGPKNYRRADERILEDIVDRVNTEGIDASGVEIRVNGGEVTLSGHVAERQSRRALEDVADSVSGVFHVDNCIRIGPH